MRIGVFGGAFDPPHAAHAALARVAREHLGLDLVIWLPTFAPPHKGAPAAPFVDRLAMVTVLVDSGKDASGRVKDLVSDLEATLPPPSYTLHTLEALRARHGEGHEWHLILGSDNWAGFPRWHQPDAVLKAATPAVYPRAGYPMAELPPLPPGSTLLNFPEMPEQSTNFRAHLASDREAALSALPPAVAAYIRAHGLYRDTASTNTTEASV